MAASRFVQAASSRFLKANNALISPKAASIFARLQNEDKSFDCMHFHANNFSRTLTTVANTHDTSAGSTGQGGRGAAVVLSAGVLAGSIGECVIFKETHKGVTIIFVRLF